MLDGCQNTRFPVRTGVLLALLVWCTAASQAAAQARDVDVQRFNPAFDSNGFLGIDGTRTPGSGRWTAAWFMDYASNLLTTTDASGDEVRLVKDRIHGVFAAQLGIGGRFALGASAPFSLWQQGERLNPAEPELPVAAFRDPRIWLKYRLLGDDADQEDQHRDGPGVALTGALDVPAGSDASYAGEQAARTELGALADFQLLGYGVGAMASWRHRYESRSHYGVRVQDEFLFGASAKLPIPYVPLLSGVIELRGATDFQQAEMTVIEGELGLRLRASKEVTLALGVGTGLTSGIGSPGVRVVWGLWWVPRNPDQDGDGIADADDSCPYLAEDRDGFEDEDGCEDPDNDNDLVPDVDDLCPNQEALEDQDEDEDGCTDPAA